MPYRFTCPGCNKSIVRIYKPKTTVRCTHKGCKISFPVPETSFLNSSLDEQQELRKRNQPRFLPPKAVADIDINDYLFSLSEEDSDSEGKEDEDKQDEKEEEKPKPPTTRYERKFKFNQQLIEDGVIPDSLYSKKAREQVEDSDVDEVDRTPHELEFYKNLVFSSEEENEEEENKESKRSTRRKGKGRADDFLFPQNSSDSDDEYQDDNEEEEDAGKFDIIFSDMEEDSEEEIIPKKRSKSSKGKEKSTTFDSPSNNKATGSTGKLKRKIREVYTAGGDTIRFEINEDGLEVPILSKKSSETNGPKKYKYGAKVGNKFNPYIIFNKLERQKIKDLHPELNNLDLSRKVGEIYASLDPIDKQRYTDIAKKEKEEFNKEYKVEEPDLPKVPPNAFILFKSRNKERFSKEFSAENGPSDYTRKVADIWKNLPAAEKHEYQAESLRLKQEFKANNPDVYKAKMERMVKKSIAKRSQKARDLHAQRK